MDLKSATPPPPTRERGSVVHHWTPPLSKGEQKKADRKAWWSTKGKVWGDKAQVWSDSIGGKLNNFAEQRLGAEAFFPVTGDMPREMEKCARLLKAFTEEGIVTTEKKNGKRKVLRKIPPSVIKNAKGLAIFTSMRSGIAPFGGAGGAGLVMGRLEDGTWSAPSSITPNNLSTGLLLGVDIYDCILVINTQKALDSFGTHKVTLGTEIAVVAGPWGAGAAVEAGSEGAPVFSYVKSRGLYAGVEIVGQVFIERFDENGLTYHWPGIKAKDILAGKVKPPPEAANLRKALADAESGQAQSRTMGGALEAEVDKDGLPILDAASTLDLEEGEVLKLPPPPSATTGNEYEDDLETEQIIRRSGVNPPALPPRRAAEGEDSGALLPTVAPPLPPRAGERPPSYDEAADLLAPEPEYAAPDHPPPHIEQLYPAPAGPPPGVAPLAIPMSPTPAPALGSPASPLSPALQTPISPITTPAPEHRPTLADLVAIGAPAEMDAGEQREWEQAWIAAETDKLAKGVDDKVKIKGDDEGEKKVTDKGRETPVQVQRDESLL